jgi:hypothetical protein
MFKKIKFGPVEQSIEDGKFLAKETPGKNFSYGSDSEEKFLENLKIMPTSWYYRTHTVQYDVNSEGYRTQEFDQIPWAESIVVIGCSNVFGIGLETEHTISSKIGKLLSVPTVNLGAPGTSIGAAFHNNVILKEKYPRPLGVVNLWTHHGRCVHYSTKSKHFTHSTMEPGDYMDIWNRDAAHSRVNAIIMTKATRLMWGDTAYAQASMYEDTADIIGCDYVVGDNNARDRGHPGIEKANEIAKLFVTKLKEQL